MRNTFLLLSAVLIILSFGRAALLGVEDVSIRGKELNGEGEEDGRVLGESTEDFRRLARVFLKEGRWERVVSLQSYVVPIWVGELDALDWQTDLTFGIQGLPIISLKGQLFAAYPLDLEGDGRDELVVEVIQGKLGNLNVYRYANNSLERIPALTEKPGPYGYLGTVTRNSPEFKDWDGDGKLELFAYYSLTEPQKRRRVEVYKFDGQRFNKIKDYEEGTAEVYL